jgi:hypothetical protein
MNNSKYLQSIANGIYAADKVRNLLETTNVRSNTPSGVVGNRIAVLGEIIKVIANYLPVENSQRGSNIQELVNKSTMCGNTYSQLKQHLFHAKEGRLKQGQLIETLAIVRPLLKDEPRVTVDKVLKIYEIIRT